MQRVCVIGLGPIGNRHADLHLENPLAELVGVCDIKKERTDRASERLGVPGFYDAQKMLDALAPDIVVLLGSPFCHSKDLLNEVSSSA